MCWLSVGSVLAGLPQLRPALRVVDSLSGWFCFVVLLSFPTVDPRGPKRMIARRTPASLATPSGDLAFTLHQEKPASSSHRDGIGAGDVILCNHVTGLVDCLYAWWMWSPWIHGTWNRFAVAWMIMYSEEYPKSTNPAPGHVHLSFPEGTCTNGRGILQFSSNPVSPRIHLICLKYQCAAVDPMYRGFLGSLWQLSILCGQLKNSLTSRMICAGALGALQKDLSAKTLQQLMAALGHIKALGMSAAEKREFERVKNG